MDMNYIDEIKAISALYYENNYLSPKFEEIATKDSVVDCAGYFYSYAQKLIQNFFRKTRDEAEGNIVQLVSKQKALLTSEIKSTISSIFSEFYLSLLNRFKEGLDYGEDSMEGFKLMLDSSTKIIAISICWLENNSSH